MEYVAFLLTTQADGASLGGELHGIVQQVTDGLGGILCRCYNGLCIVDMGVEVELVLLVVCHSTIDYGCLAELVDANGVRAFNEGATGYLRQGQQAVDE